MRNAVVISGRTSCMNFLQTGRTSLLRVAENIMTCFSTGVILKISWTSRRISEIIHRQVNPPLYLGDYHAVQAEVKMIEINLGN